MELAGLFALCAAAFLALRDIFGRFGVRGLDPIVGTGVSALLGLPILIVLSAGNGDLAHLWPKGGGDAMAAIALAGVLRITAARTLLFAATQHIGAARAGTLATTNIFFAIGLSIVFLGESLTVPIASGAALIIAGGYLMARSRPAASAAVEPSASHLKGMLLALSSALAFGSSSVLVRPVINEFASPYQANLYANAIALVAFLPIAWSRLRKTDMKAWPARTWGFIALAGSSASLGVTFIYFALARAPVVFVQPIAQSRPLFLVAISWLFLQSHESVNRRVVFGAVAIFAGAATLLLTK